MANTLIYQVEGKPKFGKLILFALQQVLAVLAATIAVPAIIGLPTQIPAAILGAGVGTIVYLLFTRFKSPVIISSSFAFLGALANALAFGYLGILLGSIFAGLVYVVIALIIHFVGTGWIHKLMPPVIIGPTVALIGLSLAGAAMGDIVKTTGSGMPYNLVALLCGLITFFVIVFCSVQKRFQSAKTLPFIIGILVGYLVASIFTIIGNAADIDYLKIVDWSPIVNNFKNISITSFLDYPRVTLVEGIKELTTGLPARSIMEAFMNNNGIVIEGAASLNDAELLDAIKAANGGVGPQILNWTGVATVALSFIPVALVTFTEHIADHTNLGSIIDRPLLEEPGLKRTLLGDGVGSIAGTMFGICPNTTYGESVGCVAITRNASVRTIFVAALMLIVLAFISPLNAALRTIPNCVMGGVCLTLYGFIAVSGLKMFKNVDLGDNKNLFTVAAILITGIGGLVINIPIGGDKFIQITSIATALLLGILTYTVCNLIEGKKKEEENGKVEEEPQEEIKGE